MTHDANLLLHEDRRFHPMTSRRMPMSQPIPTPPKADFDGFWANQAKRLSWHTEPTRVLDWSNRRSPNGSPTAP